MSTKCWKLISSSGVRPRMLLSTAGSTFGMRVLIFSNTTNDCADFSMWITTGNVLGRMHGMIKEMNCDSITLSDSSISKLNFLNFCERSMHWTIDMCVWERERESEGEKTKKKGRYLQPVRSSCQWCIYLNCWSRCMSSAIDTKS